MLTAMQKSFTEDFNKPVDYLTRTRKIKDATGFEGETLCIPQGSCLKGTEWTLNGNTYNFETYSLGDPNILLEDGYYVDTTTGELLGKVTPIKNKYLEPIRPFKSKEDLREWCLEHNLKATNNLYVDLQGLKDNFKGDDLVGVLLMVRNIKYVNTGFYTREFLVGAFKCTDANLNRKLNKLCRTGVLSYTCKDLQSPKGTIRVEFNPVYVFRGNDAYRNMFVNLWYFARNPKETSVDHLMPTEENMKILKSIVLTEEDVNKFFSDIETEQNLKLFKAIESVAVDSAESYSNAISEVLGKTCDVKTKILNCTDLDFSLFNLGVLSLEELKTV